MNFAMRATNEIKNDDSLWKKKGFHKGKQRFECFKCGYRTTNKEKVHQCD